VIEYEIRVAGVVPEALLLEIERSRVGVPPVHTVLSGSLPDQAAVHNIINRIQGLGLELIEVHRLTAGPVPVSGPLLDGAR
jgi:hypothetical protein